MHVMHVIDGLPFGGAERMLVDIANATASDGHQVSVCVTRSCLDLAFALGSDVQVHTLNRRWRFDLAPLRQFACGVRHTRVDLLHVHSRSTFSLLSLTKALGWLRTPVILHDHYGSIERNTSVPTWFRFAGRYFLDQYVGVYEKLGKWAESAGVPRNRITVIGNALDLSRLEKAEKLDLRATFGLESNTSVGVVVAGIRPDKGVSVLLRALALHPLPLRIRILVIGEAADPVYLERCRQLTKLLGLDQTVFFVGKRTDVPAAIKGADFALMPSRSESGPLVLIEYMAIGLPFVSSLVGDIAALANRAGLQDFVVPNNPSALRAAMDRLLTLNPAERQARVATGRRVASELFDLSKTMPKWYEIYHRTLNGQSA